MALEFGYDGGKSATASTASSGTNNNSSSTDLSTGQQHDTGTGESVDDVNSVSDTTNGGKTDTGKTAFGDKGTNTDDKKDDQGNQDNKNDGKSTDDNQDDNANSDLVTGTVVEFENIKYTVDPKGNLVTEDGSIFKEAKDVKGWLNDLDVDQDGDDTTLSIKSIIDTVGIEITGDNDEVIEFDNTPAGVKAYIDHVREANKEEDQKEAINNFIQEYPFVTDAVNYYIANGNSMEGFGEIQDRSQITIDDSNEAQQESIIRTAWKERGQKGDVEVYINYLKSSNILLPTAKDELSGLQEADQAYKDNIAKAAKDAEDLRIDNLNKYWKGVKEVIDNKKIAGYQIPDTIVINKDGKKTSATPNDFYNYLYQLDSKGQSAYQRDLASQPAESRRDSELLRAYLKFTGGDYSNLVEMAVNKEKVANLKVQAKTRNAGVVKIVKPANNAKGSNIDFGY